MSDRCRRADLPATPLDDHVRVHDPTSHRVHALNPSAALIWDELDEPRDVDEVTAAVADRVGLPAATLRSDVARTLADLGALGLLAPASGVAARPSPDQARPAPAPRPAGDGTVGLRVAALGTVTEIVGPGAALRALSDVLAPLASTEPADHELRIEPVADQIWSLTDDGAVVHERGRPDVVLSHVVWSVNNRAVTDSRGHLLLHAGAVTGGGGTVIVAGEPDAGKSTLTAACLRRGLSYLTDEAVRVDAGLTVAPYPKPLTLDVIGLGLLGVIEPVAPGTVLAGPGSIRHVAPSALGSTAPAAAPVAAVVLPDRSRRGAPDEPLDPVAAALALAELAFDLPGGGQRALEDLAALAMSCPVRRLPSADLADAADEVVALAGGPPGAR